MRGGVLRRDRGPCLAGDTPPEGGEESALHCEHDAQVASEPCGRHRMRTCVVEWRACREPRLHGGPVGRRMAMLGGPPHRLDWAFRPRACGRSGQSAAADVRAFAQAEVGCGARPASSAGARSSTCRAASSAVTSTRASRKNAHHSAVSNASFTTTIATRWRTRRAVGGTDFTPYPMHHSCHRGRATACHGNQWVGRFGPACSLRKMSKMAVGPARLA